MGYIATVGSGNLPTSMMGVAKCPLCEVFAIVQAQMGPKLVSVIQNSGVSTAEGFECIEVYGDTVQTFRNVRYNASVCR